MHIRCHHGGGISAHINSCRPLRVPFPASPPGPSSPYFTEFQPHKLPSLVRTRFDENLADVKSEIPRPVARALFSCACQFVRLSIFRSVNAQLSLYGRQFARMCTPGTCACVCTACVRITGVGGTGAILQRLKFCHALDHDGGAAFVKGFSTHAGFKRFAEQCDGSVRVRTFMVEADVCGGMLVCREIDRKQWAGAVLTNTQPDLTWKQSVCFVVE